MSGWYSLQSVSTLHILLQTVGCLVAVFVIASGVTAYHYWSRWGDLVVIAERVRSRYLPRWLTNTEATLHNAFAEIAILGTIALVAVAYGSHAYGQRKTELVAASHAADIATVRMEADALRRTSTQTTSLQSAEMKTVRAEADTLRRTGTQAATRQAAEIATLRAEADALRRSSTDATARHAAEMTELQQRLLYTESRRVASVESLRWEVKQAETRAETTISRLERQLGQVERRLAVLTVQRRLTINEKDLLIETLRPFAGQKVSIAGLDGNDDDKIYVTDFVEVFEAAGWEHPDVTYKRWDRDPVGIEITLNEADGRAGRVNVAIGALINVVRKLGLTDGNTVYMTGDIPAGQVQVKIGKKIPR